MDIFKSKCYVFNFQDCFLFYGILFLTGFAKPYKTKGLILLPIRLVGYFASIAVDRTRILKTKDLSI